MVDIITIFTVIGFVVCGLIALSFGFFLLGLAVEILCMVIWCGGASIKFLATRITKLFRRLTFK